MWIKAEEERGLGLKGDMPGTRVAFPIQRPCITMHAQTQGRKSLCRENIVVLLAVLTECRGLDRIEDKEATKDFV